MPKPDFLTQLPGAIFKALPIILTVAVAATANYIAIHDQLRELKTCTEANHETIQAHANGFDHLPWFNHDCIRHPALRGVLDRMFDARQDAIEARFQTRPDCRRLWLHFLELNPTLQAPRELRR